MMTTVLDGRRAADRLLARTKQQVIKLRPRPCLATVIVGRRPDSELYIRMKHQAAAHVGLRTMAVRLPSNTRQSQLITEINRLNKNPRVTGILLQLPLPSHLETESAIRTITRAKDADGLRPDAAVISPFIQSLLHLARLGKPSGNKAVILARPSPLRQQLHNILMRRKFSVTISAGQRSLPPAVRHAHLIFTFRGYGPRLQAHTISSRTVIIDGGLRPREKQMVGDAEQSVYKKAKAITPVPGGVGPLTVAYLIKNTVQLAQKKAAD